MSNGEISIPPETVFEALRLSTTALEKNSSEVKSLRSDMSRMEGQLTSNLASLEGSVRDHNAHLDNLVRELSRTNDIHQREFEERQQEKKIRAEREAQKAKMELEERSEKRKVITRAGRELWETFKIPIGTLITAIITWLVYNFFSTP